jgi:Cu(I)/Ag(I) efflux system membrane protein CusA/SilA
MKSLIQFCLDRRLPVFLLFAALAAAGLVAVGKVPVDAIPDLGENQVIVYADWPGRTPKDVEDQITFPLSTALQGISGVKEIRGQSGFGFSMVYVIFKDNVDFYFARTRIMEKLNSVSTGLPRGVVPTLGPDGTGLGQIFWYTVEGEGRNLQELRSIQDWYIRYALASVEGVSEVAGIGGYVKQYQVDVDPNKIFAYELKISDIVMAIENANIDIGAKVIEVNGMEFLIRGAGFIRSVDDIGNIVIGGTKGTPVRVKDVSVVSVGSDFRRGTLDKDGRESVGGVVVMRYKENPMAVIRRVQDKIAEISPGLPKGVRIVPFYDRTGLIEETLGTLKEAITIEIFITIAVILVFSLPFTMSLMISLTLPFSILISFILMWLFNIDMHIMSLAGIIIAIGTIVDMGIIITENIHRHLTKAGQGRELSLLEEKIHIHRGASEVATAVLGAVATTIIPFLAVLALDGQSAKLFHPVVFTKTFVLLGSLFTALFLLPPLYLEFHVWGRRINDSDSRIINAVHRFFSGRLKLAKVIGFVGMAAGLIVFSKKLLVPAHENSGFPWMVIWEWMTSNRWMVLFTVIFLSLCYVLARNAQKLIRIIVPWGLRHKWVLIVPALFFGASMYLLVEKIQNEFRPPLDEGSFLFMPVLLPSASLSQVQEVLTRQNAIIKSFPEVEHAVGKLGRIESATDPADITMIETIITLKPRKFWREGMTMTKLRDELNDALSFPGVGNIWTQPIQNRIDMLSTGIRTAVGIKVFGTDLREIEKSALEIEKVLRDVEGLRSSYVERIVGKPYIEYIIDREAISRFGLSIADVQRVIETAVGGENLTTTVEGRERYPVRLRYMREHRDSIEALSSLLIVTPGGEKIPITRVAEMRISMGPSMINSENGLLRGIIYLEVDEKIGPIEFVQNAEKVITERVTLPQGYYFRFAGDFQNQIRASGLLRIIFPLCLLGIFLIIYFGFNSFSQTFVVFLAIPVTLSGGVFLLWVLGYKMSIAVAVGFVALFGVAVDDGIILTTYINQLKKERTFRNRQDIWNLITDASVQRIRPLLMTTTTTILALVPILWATGRGSEIIRPMSVPSIGGMTIEIITILIVPLLNSLILERKLSKHLSAAETD